MGCRIIVANGEGDSNGAVFYCSTTMWAFGPVMDSFGEAVLFEKWLPEDPRSYQDKELESKYSDFRKEYTCVDCGSFFEEMDEVWRLRPTSVRCCASCGEKKKFVGDIIKEWRYDMEDLQFIPYQKSHDDLEEENEKEDNKLK
jgi:hypothetical protein